jgi:tetratricopeptide (TPR) repeat protein
MAGRKNKHMNSPEMGTNENVILDDGVPLSKTKLWEYQKIFYTREGISAWQKVPYYITSNPCIANAYANIIVRLIQEWKTKGNNDPSEPFYIIELAAGSGAFSFYLLKRITELFSVLNIPAHTIQYAMTDMAGKNIDFWMHHPAFEHHVNDRLLDFSKFNVEKDDTIEFMLSGKKITSSNPPKNPCIILANYIFDSIPQDLFYIDHNECYEGLTCLKTTSENVKNDLPVKLDTIDISFSYRPISGAYYSNRALDSILDHFKNSIDEGFFTFPVASLECVDRLKLMCGNKLALLSSDKGYSRHQEYFRHSEPFFAFHDNCFSMDVNFHAIDHYFRAFGGDVIHQYTQKDLATSVFLSEGSFEEMPEVRLAAQNYLNDLGHSSIFETGQYFIRCKIPPPLSVLIPFMASTGWDPFFLYSITPGILRLIQSGKITPPEIDDLQEVLPKFANNYYHTPHAADVMFSIGLLLQEVRQYEESIRYYELSQQYFGEREEVLYNIALCYASLDKPEHATEYFRKILVINSGHILARGWLAHFEYEMLLADAV